MFSKDNGKANWDTAEAVSLMNADPRIHDEKQFGIFISYAGKGKIFRHVFFFPNVTDRANFKVSLLGSGFH